MCACVELKLHSLPKGQFLFCQGRYYIQETELNSIIVVACPFCSRIINFTVRMKGYILKEVGSCVCNL